MKSDGNGKTSTDIEPLGTVRRGDVALDRIDKCSDYDSTSATKGMVEDPKLMDAITTENEVKALMRFEQIATLPISRTTESEELNAKFTQMIRPPNPGGDAESHVNASLGDGKITGFVESEEKTAGSDDNKLTAESIGDNSSGFETSNVCEDKTSAIVSPNRPVNATLIPSPAIIDSDKDFFLTKKVCAPRLSVERKGLNSISTNVKVSAKISDTNLLFRNQQRNSDSTSSGIQQLNASLTISSLPIDFLHNIASFLIPIEWTSFGKCSKATNKICKEIFRRVRMHGFRCATEVITSWVRIFTRHINVMRSIIFQEVDT